MGDHTISKIDHANHLLLDQPLLRLPFELLRKNFRSAHFTVEHGSSAVKNLLKTTATGALNGRSSPDDVVKNLDTMIARMRGIKRKLAACADEEARLYRQVGARATHLGDLARMHTLDDVAYDGWSRRRLDRLLVDYLLRHGYNDSAKALASQRDMNDLVDIETFVAMSKIRDSLKAGSVKEALDWCTDNKKELRKMDSNLEFQLRFQQYIELVRTQQQGKMLEAIVFAKKFLVPFKESFPREVSQAGALLAFPPDHAGREYRDMYSPARWGMLADVFTETHNALLALPSFPLLHIALSSGLSALKTPACHSSHPSSSATPSHSTSLTTSVCPICSTELNQLARNVPYAHHSKSHVEHDLLLLPNGRVYGKAKLEEYAKKAALPDGQVKDLRTGEVYSTDKMKKVFIT